MLGGEGVAAPGWIRLIGPADGLVVQAPCSLMV
jgi:hypothetical protein